MSSEDDHASLENNTGENNTGENNTGKTNSGSEIDLEIDFNFDLAESAFLGHDNKSSKTLNTTQLATTLEKVFADFFSREILGNNQVLASSEAKQVQSVVFECEILNEQEIRDLNHQFRDKNSVTDVISLANSPNLREDIVSEILPVLHIGSVHICEQKIFEQATEFEIAPADEFIHLLVHGFLHLIGFDHEISEAEEKLMEQNEALIIDQVARLMSTASS